MHCPDTNVFTTPIETIETTNHIIIVVLSCLELVVDDLLPNPSTISTFVCIDKTKRLTAFPCDISYSI